MGKELEVESGEACVMSSTGTMAIIPKNRVAWVKKKLEENCNNCLDHYISTLPSIGNNAEKGMKDGY